MRPSSRPGRWQRVDALYRQARQRVQCAPELQQPLSNPQPAHPRVDLDVDANCLPVARAAGKGTRAFEGANRLRHRGSNHRAA